MLVGTAAALHAPHRLSIDGDHVLSDLSERFAVTSAGARTPPRPRPVASRMTAPLTVANNRQSASR